MRKRERERERESVFVLEEDRENEREPKTNFSIQVTEVICIDSWWNMAKYIADFQFVVSTDLLLMRLNKVQSKSSDRLIKRNWNTRMEESLKWKFSYFVGALLLSSVFKFF